MICDDAAAQEAIVVSALPPEAAASARVVCKRLRASRGAAPLLVGLWHAGGDLQTAQQRLQSGGATHVVTSFAGCVAELELLNRGAGGQRLAAPGVDAPGLEVPPLEATGEPVSER